jgi:hypothetical protein
LTISILNISKSHAIIISTQNKIRSHSSKGPYVNRKLDGVNTKTTLSLASSVKPRNFFLISGVFLHSVWLYDLAHKKMNQFKILGFF